MRLIVKVTDDTGTILAKLFDCGNIALVSFGRIIFNQRDNPLLIKTMNKAHFL